MSKMSTKKCDDKNENEDKVDFLEICDDFYESDVNMEIDDLPDDSGKILDDHYAYYDTIFTCWRNMDNYVKMRGIPICEYMTVYNFSNFIENM